MDQRASYSISMANEAESEAAKQLKLNATAIPDKPYRIKLAS
jgi:hypothetical protein